MSERKRIVVLGRDETLAEELQPYIDSLGCRIEELSSGGQLVDMVVREPPDLIILESVEGDEGAFDLCRRIRLCAESFIPIIVVSKSPAAENKKAAFDSGADDYLTRPLDIHVTCARIRCLLRLKSALDNLHESREELQKANERLARLAVEDGLTGLFNHRHMLELLAMEVERAKRYEQPLSCVMLDLDRFADINDAYGHLAGDATLKRVAAILSRNCRRTDLVCRYGGDEFLIICPHTDIQHAAQLAERLRRALLESGAVGDGQALPVSASFGVASFSKDSSVTDLVSQADHALYHAKRKGGNRVCLYPEEEAMEQAERS